MKLSTRGWTQYMAGGVTFMAGLIVALPVVALRLGWGFVGRLENHEFVVWDVINFGSRGFQLYTAYAIIFCVLALRGGFLLLVWGKRNLKNAERRR